MLSLGEAIPVVLLYVSPTEILLASTDQFQHAQIQEERAEKGPQR